MATTKFTQVPGYGRGRKRTAKGDQTGSVRVTFVLPGVKGNQTRSFSVHGKVSTVHKLALDTLVMRAAA